MFHKKTVQDMIHERVRCRDEAANHPLPIAVAFWIMWIVSVEEWPNLTQNLMQINCFTHSVILNMTATKYTCSLTRIYHPCWLVQWSCHCSHMCIPVHSPWLPGSIDVMQTLLIILTMAGLFPDRPRTCIWNTGILGGVVLKTSLKDDLWVFCTIFAFVHPYFSFIFKMRTLYSLVLSVVQECAWKLDNSFSFKNLKGSICR